MRMANAPILGKLECKHSIAYLHGGVSGATAKVREGPIDSGLFPGTRAIIPSVDGCSKWGKCLSAAQCQQTRPAHLPRTHLSIRTCRTSRRPWPCTAPAALTSSSRWARM